MENAVVEGSFVDLFMIEEIDAENNQLILANYIFNKKVSYPVTDEEIERYAYAFDEAISQNMFLSVEYDEKRGVIIG
ncbi:hypothetical protein BME96_18915 (plasmid) [Virgibacillus halodenitrificans]|uniref:Uncharacterized protein n=1 Tax=Virgibacillus halodenitrificans TaxID=1482 RepID=A0AAC9J3P1_VIRHA|nr:DUF5511 family protein [Virgibacillus halodenitrificans]APC50355.1 hypothetical protein BME96_18915 [Virgibacillus halodenitrificans]AVD54444.1 hypothetical protein CKF96_02725 [Priestia filamentosa]CDQ37722.1 hypothetical protein BN993_07284 [Virgibacillus halodenitrificans]